MIDTFICWTDQLDGCVCDQAARTWEHTEEGLADQKSFDSHAMRAELRQPVLLS